MRERIESAANKKIKLAASLAQRKRRQKEGKFVAEGVRLVEMAAASDWTIDFALFTSELEQDERGAKLLTSLEAKCPVCEVSAPLFKKASGTETPQGILAVVRMNHAELDTFAESDNPFYVILDGVQDPGNAGTIIRTADAAGADGIIFLTGCVDVFDAKTVRAAMGSLFHIAVVTNVNRAELLDFTTKKGLKLYATALDDTAKTIYETDLTGDTAVVFGNEGNGVSEELLHASQSVYIPMYGGAESLNVNASAAIVLYEAVRQRHF